MEVSRDAVDGHPAYGMLLADAATTGRCPVWISDRGLERLQPPEHPVLAEVARLDAAEILDDQWPGACYVDCDCRDPFGATFPGLVPAPEPVDDPVAAAIRFAGGPRRAHLAVVPVSRPADIPATLGWLGAGNYLYDLACMSAVLRSWEDRFGAVLVHMDSATLLLSVAAPPSTREECLGVAAEHFAFCCDVDGEDPRPLRVYAQGLHGAQRWRFWRD